MTPFLHRLAPSTMEENPLWLVVLCDMMTNLMLLFLMMFGLTLQQPPAGAGGSGRARGAGAAAERRHDAEGLVETPKERRARELISEAREGAAAGELKARLAAAGLGAAAEVAVAEDGVRVRLREPLLFATAEAALAPRAGPVLALLARVLAGLPNEVVVEGHTDDVPVVSGPYRTNWELSVARATSVIGRLCASGIAPERLVAAGYGEHRPAAPNAGEEGRGRNRRVEILILRSEPSGG